MPLATSVERQVRANTEETLKSIEETLYGFALVNGRLPCPDCKDGTGDCAAAAAAVPVETNDGKEDRIGGPSPNLVCATSIGNVPWVNIGVDQYDAWGRVFSYRVTGGFAKEITFVYTPTLPCTTSSSLSAFDLCMEGDIDIVDGYESTTKVAENIPAIVISHGKNHYFDTQTDDEKENFERTPTIFDSATTFLSSYTGTDYTNAEFVYKGYTLDEGEIAYDDIMVWISPFKLKNKLVRVGKLP